jgi:argininosuccinate lyase
MMKSLPLAYNRDMQEDKAPLFSAVDTLAACVEIYTDMLPEIKFKKKNMQRAAASGFLNATDLADYLTTRGIPFREAHRLAGKAVSFALERKKELHELTLEQLQSFSALIQKDIFSRLTPRQMIEQRTSFGGTSGKMVAGAIEVAEKWLNQKKDHLPGSK